MTDFFDDNLITRQRERSINFWAEIERLKRHPDYQEPTCVVARSVEEGQMLAAWIEEFESEHGR